DVGGDDAGRAAAKNEAAGRGIQGPLRRAGRAAGVGKRDAAVVDPMPGGVVGGDRPVMELIDQPAVDDAEGYRLDVAHAAPAERLPPPLEIDAALAPAGPEIARRPQRLLDQSLQVGDLDAERLVVEGDGLGQAVEDHAERGA